MIVIVPGFATECIRVNSISFCFAFPKFKDFHLLGGPQKSSIAAILSILGLVHFLQTFHNNSNCILKPKSKSTTTGHIFYHTDAKSKNSGKDVAECLYILSILVGSWVFKASRNSLLFFKGHILRNKGGGGFEPPDAKKPGVKAVLILQPKRKPLGQLHWSPLGNSKDLILLATGREKRPH